MSGNKAAGKIKSRFCKTLLMISLALLCISFNGFAQEGGNALPENPLNGRVLFSSKLCIRCHSIQGIGGKAGPDLGEVPLGSMTTIMGSLWSHFPRMIETFDEEGLRWPHLTAEESQSLFTFIYFLDFFDRASNPALGERLFLEKSCIRCHSVGGKGGDEGPDLDTFQVNNAAPFITAALWNSGPDMMKTMQKEKIPRPGFQERDVIDILAFIRIRGLSSETTRKYLPPPNPLQGRKVFEEKSCVRCHAIWGNGGYKGTKGNGGPDLAKGNLKGSWSHMISQMWNHGADMWPRMVKEGIAFPEFSPEEMSDLISYLYFIQFQGPKGSSDRGAEVFAEKRCKLCHMPEKSYEKAVGPDLAKSGLDSPFRIVAEMWNHAPDILEKMKEKEIRWPTLEKDEMRDLIAFILSLK